MASKELKVKLSKNLRRDILRGHPWVYREALSAAPRVDRSQLCKVVDHKGIDLAWAIYDPNSPLALRILSTERRTPGGRFFTDAFARAVALRSGFSKTTGYRLFNGEGDRLPGLVCDVYDKVAILQFDGMGPSQFWQKDEIASWLLDYTECHSVYLKPREKNEGKFLHVAGDVVEPIVEFSENGMRFSVDLENGQKTGFFFDQRDNRSYLGCRSQGKRLLNLFSYTGGFSVYAGVGGAREVTSVDISSGALEFADKSWKLNGLDSGKHRSVCSDVFEFLQKSEGSWDAIVVDPPSMARSEGQKLAAIKKYTDIFSAAAKKLSSGGDLYLSSCSSHISFSDFFEISELALSQARRKGQVLRVSGQGEDHPFPHVCPELRYLKFLHLVLD